MWIACITPPRKSRGCATRSSYQYDERRFLLGLQAKSKIRSFHFVSGCEEEVLFLEVDAPAEIGSILAEPAMREWSGCSTVKLVAAERESGSFQQVGDELVFSDSLTIEARLESVYQLLWDAARWPGLLAHVKSVRMLEERPGFQRFLMETMGAAGTHTTESVRESDSPAEIRYTQVTPPAMLRQHRGIWRLAPAPEGIQVTSEHRIELAEEQIEPALGRPYTLREAGLLSRHFIGNHSVATLAAIKRCLEAPAVSAVSGGAR